MAKTKIARGRRVPPGPFRLKHHELESPLNGRIVVTPDEQTGKFTVRIPLTSRGIFEGICGSQGVTSPAGTDQKLRPEFRLFLPAA